MSASSARRLRDRAGSGTGPKASATLKSSKPLTPIPMIDKRSSTGKENPLGSTSKSSVQSVKPAIRPMTRVDKASVPAVCAGDNGLRRSTSSASRGRSSSPSEFMRVFSDMRKDRRVSTDRTVREPGSVRESDRAGVSAGKALNGVRVSDSVKKKKSYGDLGLKASDLGGAQIRVSKDGKEAGRNAVNMEKKSEVREELDVKVIHSEKNLNRVRDFGNCVGHSNLSSDSVNPNGSDSSRTLKDCSDEGSLIYDKKVPKLVGVDNTSAKIGKGVHLGQREMSEKSMNEVKVLELPKEKGLGEESIGGRGGSKYQSKLHEKLAFLEGKVKRIASDIKRTKEMLDMNNPDASKVILLDIQDTISGIEKAMGNGTVDPVAKKKGFSKDIGQEERDVKMVEKGQIEEVGNCSSVKVIEQVDNGKSSGKGLKTEDLEARLFPHHKLLRGRTTLKASSVIYSQSAESHVGESICESKVDEKSLDPIEENPIAVEFLASLNKEKTKVAMRDAQAGSEYCEVQEMDIVSDTGVQDSSNITIRKDGVELILTTDETFDEFDDQENSQEMILGEEIEDTSIYQLNEIGSKASTAGWFVSEGESVLLAHDDGSCTFYDIVNCEEKVVYKPPAGVSPNMWRDCWIVRAPSADGCSGRYVVAASAGNAMDSGFCSWDFYGKDVRAFHTEGGVTPSRTVLGPLPNNISSGRSALCNILDPEIRQWWYKPCGPLIISTASCQKVVRIFDIRDGEQVMKWDIQKPVLTMDYSSPLQWRNRGKVVVAEAESVSLWDVNSLNPQALQSVSSAGRKVSALHVNNTDAELGGGVRQRATSSEAEGNDGVFCTQDSINILDFRHPTGVGLKISKLGINVQSVFSRGDSIYLGCSNVRSVGKRQSSSEVQQFSVRKQRVFSTYALPECNADSHQTAITQVWGNSNIVMGVCGRGLFVFDAFKDNEVPSFTSTEVGNTETVRETVGPDDLYSPCFDYLGSRALLISRDRPALWRHLT